MNAAQYRRGCLFRMRKNRLKSMPGTVSFFLAAIVLVAVLLIGADLFFFLLPLILFGMGLYEIGAYSRSCAKEFESLPFLHGTQKCTLGEDGLELQSSFERLFVRYGDIYAVKNKRRYVLILLTFGKGIIFLDKKENGSEAQELLKALEKGGVKV